MWRDTPVLRGGSFDLLLDYNQIRKGSGIAIPWLLGCWGL